jgi:signal transduction histidine kinase
MNATNKLAEMNDIRIDVRSQEGEGTQFKLIFPADS